MSDDGWKESGRDRYGGDTLPAEPAWLWPCIIAVLFLAASIVGTVVGTLSAY